MAGTVSLYLQDRTLAKLDAAVERCAAEDRAKGLTGREVTNRSRLIERIIEEHLAAEPKLSMEDIRYHVVSLAEEYGAEKVSLFGSYAHGEASESSDVDLLLEKGAIRGFRVLDFQDAPARRLGENFDEGGVSRETFVR
ncbi:nucleotidyltransferase family protein [Eggerthella timonensis]|uniref:nucleotidyltransferase family protein n=1 Tax=Eggerthella timonensis TaxID=1871008 RepID=UPI001C609425|nr:nucleotidyltransferase domain-containing protein [Eggerthella timonensis]